jgi:hypothetical protein
VVRVRSGLDPVLTLCLSPACDAHSRCQVPRQNIQVVDEQNGPSAAWKEMTLVYSFSKGPIFMRQAQGASEVRQRRSPADCAAHQPTVSSSTTSPVTCNSKRRSAPPIQTPKQEPLTRKIHSSAECRHFCPVSRSASNLLSRVTSDSYCRSPFPAKRQDLTSPDRRSRSRASLPATSGTKVVCF